MITDILDEPYRRIREFAKIPAPISDSEVMTIYGSEAVATLGEIASDLFLQPGVSKAVQVGAGAVLGLAASLVPVMPDRGRKELMEISSHLVSRLIDPSPQQIREIRRNVEELVSAIKSMDVTRVVEASLRSPREIQQSIQEFKEMVGVGSTWGSPGGLEFERGFEEVVRERPMMGTMY